MLELSCPAGILFDLGNTLLSQDEFDAERGTEHLLSFANNPLGLTASDICALVAALDADLVPRRENSWLEVSPYAVHRLVYEPNRITFDRPFEELELEFWRTATRFRPTEGVQELLENLGARGLPLGVVSNSTFTSRTLAWQVREAGLGHHFEFVISSADYVVRKPHPTIFRVAAQLLGVSPSDTWFIGDTVEYDVAGALEAGMTAILYTADRRSVQSEAHLVVGRWEELSEHLSSAMR